MAKKKIDFTLAVSVIYILVAGGILIFGMDMNITGMAVYSPIQVQGTIYPGLPDGTEIDFKVGYRGVASTTLKDSGYGYEEKVIFEMDDPTTAKIEGYAPGDIVNVYIMDVGVVEFSSFEGIVNEKNIHIPASKRFEVANKAAYAVVKRSCVPSWQCGEWSACVNDMRTRICSDMNNCGVEDDKSAESEVCTTKVPLLESPLATIKDKISFEVVILGLVVIMLIGFTIYVVRKVK
ncbi:MAG: hypothetical protein V3V78_02900 [Candidatus Woesearchaeota archaeon]